MFDAFSRRIVFFPVRNRRIQAALRPWEMTVASAAPCTPMPKTKMNTGSRMILATAPKSTVIMPILPKPWLLIKLFIPSPTITNTLPSR